MRAIHVFTCILLASASAVALAAPASFATFADQLDAIGLGRASDALGDVRIEQALLAAENREAALVAARAALFSRAPERLIPELVALACGRDPALAPEAALTLYKLAEGMTLESFAAREVLLSDVKEALQSLEVGCAQEPRPDLLVAIETLRAQLVALQ